MAASPGDTLYADASATVEPAPAKINLALHVTGRRADGYHLLDTLVVFADEGDLIRAAEESSGGAIKTEAEGPFGEALTEALKTGDNLVLKAAQAMGGRRFGREGLRLIISKRLPLASGMGGGSADAAATLRLLDRLNAGDGRGLNAIAARLGADVPMCLVSEPLRAQGIGDRIERVAGIPALPLVLVNAGDQLSAAQVYQGLERADDKRVPSVPPRGFRSIFELVIWLRQTWNSLEAPARAQAKSIKRVLAALQSDPDCLIARMTGSGPTCFGIFASPAAAQRAAIRLRVGRPEWWITACVTGPS